MKKTVKISEVTKMNLDAVIRLEREITLKGTKSYNAALESKTRTKSLKTAYKHWDDARHLRSVINEMAFEEDRDVRHM